MGRPEPREKEKRKRKEKEMKKVLLKDIVIPAGTVLSDAPSRTERSDGIFAECVIGLSKNSFGTFTYEVNPEDKEDQEILKEYFTDLK